MESYSRRCYRSARRIGCGALEYFEQLEADHARYMELHRSTKDEELQNEQRVAELERELRSTKQQLEQ